MDKVLDNFYHGVIKFHDMDYFTFKRIYEYMIINSIPIDRHKDEEDDSYYKRMSDIFNEIKPNFSR